MTTLALLWTLLAGLRLWQRATLGAAGWSAWAAAFDLRRELSLRSFTQSVDCFLSVFDSACRVALRAHSEHASEDARKALTVAQRVAGEFVPYVCTRLRAWCELARLLHAARPVEPLRARDLRIGRLRELARAETACAWILSGLWRLRLHLRVLHACLAQTVDFTRAEAVPDPDVSWPTLDALRADVGTLARDSVRTYDAVLRSVPSPLSGRLAAA